MRKLLVLMPLILFFVSCDNEIKADYNTIRTKKLILIGEDGKDYLLQVKQDSSGKVVLVVDGLKN